MRANRSGTYILPLAAVIVTVAMVVYSDAAFEAAVSGLKVWWEVVFPALLPFFIGSEVLMGLGVVHFMGVVLEPLMRPVFNVPGAGSFVLAMGLASGYPIGSILTARLRKQGLCSKTEGERLMSFTNTADPLFMGGAVATGMFGRIDVAGVIIAAHYLSATTLGVLLRFYGSKTDVTPAARDRRRRSLFARALEALSEARERDTRPLGQLLGDAVRNSVNTLLVIGGFIIMFSVIIRMLDLAGLVRVLAGGFSALTRPLGVDPSLGPSMVSGLFEITIGTKAASQAAAALNDRLIVAGAIIAWSGLSVHAQVAAMIQGTGMSVVPYVVSRVAHAALAGAWTALLLAVRPPFGPPPPAAAVVPALGPAVAPATAWLSRLASSAQGFTAVSALLILGTIALLNAGRRGMFGFYHRR